MHPQLLLTQHFFALAACSSPRCSAHHWSSHWNPRSGAKSKPNFRYQRCRTSGSWTNRPIALAANAGPTLPRKSRTRSFQAQRVSPNRSITSLLLHQPASFFRETVASIFWL